MYFLTQEMEFCYGHRLLNYDGKCKNLHGHNGKVEILLGGETLDHRGMLIDFTDVKRLLRTWIDDNLDHQTLLHESDPLLPLLQEHGQPIYVMDTNPTAENIARLIYEQAIELGLPVREVRLWETAKSSSIYKQGWVRGGTLHPVRAAVCIRRAVAGPAQCTSAGSRGSGPTAGDHVLPERGRRAKKPPG